VILSGKSESSIFFFVNITRIRATTHTDLYLRAVQMGVKCQVIHNASIMNAVGAAGLQLYHFGQTVSIPWWTEKWRPASFYEKIGVNKAAGMHTLCLLDIKVKEVSEENLYKGKMIYESPRFMSVQEALQQLVAIEEEQQKGWCTQDMFAIGLMRVGSTTQTILAGTIGEMLALPAEAFGAPLHSLILPGATLHDLELEMMKHYAVPSSTLLQKK